MHYGKCGSGVWHVINPSLTKRVRPSRLDILLASFSFALLVLTSATQPASQALKSNGAGTNGVCERDARGERESLSPRVSPSRAPFVPF